MSIVFIGKTKENKDFYGVFFSSQDFEMFDIHMILL